MAGLFAAFGDTNQGELLRHYEKVIRFYFPTATPINAAGVSLAICNNLTAAPEGERSPRSQATAVALGTFNKSAKTAWLTLSCLRMVAISSGDMVAICFFSRWVRAVILPLA